MGNCEVTVAMKAVLILVIFAIYNSLQDKCCFKKIVEGTESLDGPYIFLRKFDPPSSKVPECVDSCIYSRDVLGHEGEEYCFTPTLDGAVIGDQCEAPPTTTPPPATTPLQPISTPTTSPTPAPTPAPSPTTKQECSATTPAPPKNPPLGSMKGKPFTGKSSPKPPVGSLQTEPFKGPKASPPHKGILLKKPPTGKKDENKEINQRSIPPIGFELPQPPWGVNFSRPYKGNEIHPPHVGVLHPLPPAGKDLNKPWTGPCTPVPPTGQIVTLNKHLGK